MAKKLRKAVFPVGGLGTRFLPATKVMPKEMLPIVDKPLIQYAYEEAVAAGIEQFIFVTGRNKNVINNHFDHSYELQQILDEKEKQTELELTKEWLPEAGNVAFIRQQEPLGLGHAVWCARNYIDDDEPFAVLLADDIVQSNTPCLKQMANIYNSQGGSIVAVNEVPPHKTNSYGVIVPSGDTTQNIIPMQDMVEKPEPANAPSNLAIIGRYILNGGIFKHLQEGKIGAGGEIQLTDAMAAMAKTDNYYAYKFEGKRYDCGNKLGYLEANLAYALQRSDMYDGVKDIVKSLNI